MIDITEILVHWHAGRSQAEIAESLDLDRKTVRKYIEPAIVAGFTPSGVPAMSEADWAPLVRAWFPHLSDTRLRRITWPQFDRHRDYISAQLKAGVTKATIHQRLRDEHGVEGSLTSLKRYIALVLSEDAARSKVAVLREDPEPGAEAQIDYGLLGSWPNPASGRSQRVWAFVMVLSHSRHMFVHPVLAMDQVSWTASHVEAFAFFGGVPARLVPDNLRTGVERSDLYDPKINRSYAELAAHYRTLIDPARRRKPKDKGRVERPMQYIRDSFWLGREFSSLEQIQAQALHWCREVAGRRKARPLDGRAPIEVFEAHEAGTLIPLPREPFALAEWSRVKVSSDIHVKVGRGFYSVPWRLLGQEVDVRATERLCPEGKLTPALSRGKRRNMPLTLVVIDEVQEYLQHPTHGAVILDLLVYLARVAPAVGVSVMTSTQKPDDKACPSVLRDQHQARFSLKVGSWQVSDVVLGAGSYSEGLDASRLLRSHKGVGLLKGMNDEAGIVRTYLADGRHAESILTCARTLRLAEGTLTGDAAGELADEGGSAGLLDDIAAVLSRAEDRVWSETVVDRLAEHKPEMYGPWAELEGEAKAKQLAAALKPFGIGTEQIGRRIDRRAVTRRGIIHDHIVAAITARDKNRSGN